MIIWRIRREVRIEASTPDIILLREGRISKNSSTPELSKKSTNKPNLTKMILERHWQNKDRRTICRLRIILDLGWVISSRLLWQMRVRLISRCLGRLEWTHLTWASKNLTTKLHPNHHSSRISCLKRIQSITHSNKCQSTTSWQFHQVKAARRRLLVQLWRRRLPRVDSSERIGNSKDKFQNMSPLWIILNFYSQNQVYL